ncbi:MAG: hypothetical protein ACKOSR_10195, partial [Flavobacteriales bacterium]
MNIRKNFIVRAIAGFFFALLLMVCCISGYNALLALGTFLVAMGLFEYSQLIRRLTDAPLKLWIFIPLGVGIFLLSAFSS